VTFVKFARACRISFGVNELNSLILSMTELYNSCIAFCGEEKRFSVNVLFVIIVA
jgi:hypothetical protein